MSKQKILGTAGEQAAKRHLQNKGYRFIGQNVKLFCGEIDLLMQDKNELVIVEVKTKSSAIFGKASDMITLKKKKKLLQLGKTLWQKYPRKNIRIDVVAIDENHIKHIENAVEE